MLLTTWADVYSYYVYCYLADVIAICLWQMLTTYTTLGLMLLHTVLSMLTDVFVNYIEDICLADVIAIYVIVADVTTKADVTA